MSYTSTICVIVASRGRPEFIEALLGRLAGQLQSSDKVVISVPEMKDVPATISEDILTEVVTGPAGLTKQRNRGLQNAREHDIIVFFDDDLVPCRHAIASIRDAFEIHPYIGGLTGVLLADGILGPGLTIDEANRLVDEADANTVPEPPKVLLDLRGLYGCNMAFRSTAIAGLWFDERLPFYGWQEDVDFSNQVPMANAKIDSLIGVHCGTKSGRELNGKRLGYSQIVNPVYLMKKGTMNTKLACRHMCRNLLSNHLKLFAPEPWIDRRGRMQGNWKAIGDILRGRVDPERILDM